MTKVGEEILKHNVLELTEQLYAAYNRIRELDHEVLELRKTLENQQIVIDGLAAELSGNGIRS